MYKISTDNIGDVKKYVWHYRKENKEHGPFTYEDIVDMVKKGDIGPEDYVLKFGNRKFIKASEVQGLFDVIEKIQEKPISLVEVSKELPVENKEEKQEEHQISFENITTHIQSTHKEGASRNKLVMIISAVLGLCLVVWILTKLL